MQLAILQKGDGMKLTIPNESVNCIGFRRNGHHHIIAWRDENAFQFGEAIGKIVCTPEYGIDIDEWLALVERGQQLREGKQ